MHSTTLNHISTLTVYHSLFLDDPKLPKFYRSDRGNKIPMGKQEETLKCKNIFKMRYNILGHLIGEIKKNALSTGLFSCLTLSEQCQILVQTQRKKEQGQNLLFSMI